MYLVQAINSDRQHNCWMSAERLQYVLGGKKSNPVNAETKNFIATLM